jgi:hypothetical protein
MPSSPPDPPDGLPAAVVDSLDGLSPAALRRLAEYAETLATHREQESDSTEQANATTEADQSTEDLPDGVPAKATLTVKEINDNRYHYWQWREGDKIKSKYKGPVTDGE